MSYIPENKKVRSISTKKRLNIDLAQYNFKLFRKTISSQLRTVGRSIRGTETFC